MKQEIAFLVTSVSPARAGDGVKFPSQTCSTHLGTCDSRNQNISQDTLDYRKRDDRICKYSLSSSAKGVDSKGKATELELYRIWSRRFAGEKFSSINLMIVEA